MLVVLRSIRIILYFLLYIRNLNVIIVQNIIIIIITNFIYVIHIFLNLFYICDHLLFDSSIQQEIVKIFCSTCI